MSYFSTSVCLVCCWALLISSSARGTNMAEPHCSAHDEASLLQKEASVTIRAPDEEPQYDTDENGVMAMPEKAKVTFEELPENEAELAPGDDPKHVDFYKNMQENDRREQQALHDQAGESKEAYDKFVSAPNKPGHVHYKPGTLFIPEKDSAKMQHAYVKASELVGKAKKVKNSVVKGLEKAEEMVMVSMPSLDEVSEKMVEEDESEKYHVVGMEEESTGRRRRVSLDESLPEWAKKRAAELPDKVMERRAKNEENRQKARKIWDLQSTVGTEAAVEEIQNQAQERVQKGVKNIGQVLSKWTTSTTTEGPEKPIQFVTVEDSAESGDSDASAESDASVKANVDFKPSVEASVPASDDSDDSGSSMISLATSLNVLVLISVMYSSS